MHTKLTLRLEDELIHQIKAYAKQQNKSVSQIVADYFKMLAQQQKLTPPVPPITQSLTGILQDHKVNEADYKRFLKDKYL